MHIHHGLKVALRYIHATRPWSITASLTPVLLGTLLAKIEFNNFDWSIFVMTLLCVITIHCAGNIVNTYYDYQNNVDTSSSDDLTLVNRLIKRTEIFWFFVILYAFGSIFFFIILMLSKADPLYLVTLFCAGFACSFFYTGSFGLKYYALGEVVIALAFGPVSVLFPFIAQTGKVFYTPVLYIIPLLLNTEAILHGNNSRDSEEDKKSGIVTLSILIGDKCSYWFYTLLLFLPYITVFALAALKSYLFLLTLLTIPLALNLEKSFRLKDLKVVPKQTAKLNLVFSVCYFCGFTLDWNFRGK